MSAAERVEQAAGGRGGRDPDGVTQLAVEIAAAERGPIGLGSVIGHSSPAVTS